jgi:hypothetical protein
MPWFAWAASYHGSGEKHRRSEDVSALTTNGTEESGGAVRRWVTAPGSFTFTFRSTLTLTLTLT